MCAQNRAHLSPASLEEGGREVSSFWDPAGHQELSPFKSIFGKWS